MADTTSQEAAASEGETREPLRTKLRSLYYGSTRKSAWFQYALLAFDVVSIAFFIVTTFIDYHDWILVVDVVIALIILADLVARFYVSAKPLQLLFLPATIADVIVIISLIVPVFADMLFMRVLRALRLLRSYHLLGMLKRESAWFRRNEEVIQSILNLAVFVFVVTALVFTTQHDDNPQIRSYMDALYFTIATLTTTGFGDITLVGEFGHFLSVLIMIFGISLFLRLVQTVFRPAKIRFPCPDCGLLRHDPDAVHCKHCGHVLKIPNEGE